MGTLLEHSVFKDSFSTPEPLPLYCPPLLRITVGSLVRILVFTTTLEPAPLPTSDSRDPYLARTTRFQNDQKQFPINVLSCAATDHSVLDQIPVMSSNTHTHTHTHFDSSVSTVIVIQLWCFGRFFLVLSQSWSAGSVTVRNIVHSFRSRTLQPRLR